MNRGEATTKVLRSALPTHQKLILLSYIEHQTSSDAVEAGVSFPGVATIAADISSSERTVTRHRAALIEAGLLTVVREVGGGLLFCKVDLSGLTPRPKRQDTESGTGDGESATVVTESGVTQSQGDTESARGDSVSGRGDTESVGGDAESPEPSVENPPQRTLRREPSVASPAEPVPPPASEPPEQTTLVEASPLWAQRGLPKPGKGCPTKLLTPDVLDVWAYWQKVHVEAGRGKARTIGKDATKVIHEALQWEPTSADECPEGWTIKKLLCTVLAYAYRAPADSPGVEWWRKPERAGSDLNPETLLRLGRDGKLPRNARWAVAWSLAQRSPSLQVLDGGKGQQPTTMSRPMPSLTELWAKWSNPLTRRADFEQLGIRSEDWRSFIQAAVVAGQAREISAMHPIDRKASEARFTESVRAWLNEPGREVACG